MKIFCISDSLETALGMRLSGAESIVLTKKEEIDKKLDEISENSEIGILVISKGISKISKEKIDDIKIYRRTPLVVEI